MKRIILLALIVVSTIITGCSKDADTLPEEPKQSTEIKATLEAKYIEEFDGILYPSYVYSIAGLKDTNGKSKNMEYFSLKIQSNNKFDAKIRVSNDKFIKETVVNKTIEQGINEIGIVPIWKFDDFINITKSGQTYFKFELIDSKTDKVITNESIQLEYRSINECVFLVKTKDNKFSDLRYMFASYVNEDSPIIEKFLKEVGETWKQLHQWDNGYPYFHGWVGEQRGEEYIAMQIVTILLYLHFEGFTYSNITDTSASSQKVYSQYVRFIENTAVNKQANCVDGSVFLASVFKKIGLKPQLILQPGHMYLGIKINAIETVYIETTAIQYIQVAKEMVISNKLQRPDGSTIIDVNEIRSLGIKPIQ